MASQSSNAIFTTCLYSNLGHKVYTSQGDFYIDPWRPVERALITHGHADHARYGSKKYLCTEIAAPVIRHRLGDV